MSSEEPDEVPDRFDPGLVNPAEHYYNRSLAPQPKSRFNPRLIIGVVVAAVVVWSLISSRGTTSARALEPGVCFNLTDDTEIRRLETPSCDEPHDSQIMAELVDLDGPDTYPNDFDPFWETAFESCVDEVTRTAVRTNELNTDDLLIDMFTPSEQGWEQGDREVLCFIHSPTGLDGSFHAPSGT